MRIVSPFRDYYDVVQGQGFDDAIIYRRKTVKTDVRSGVSFDRAAGAGWTVRQPSPDFELLPEFHAVRPEVREKEVHGERVDPWTHDRYAERATPGMLYFCGKAYPFWISHPQEGSGRDIRYSFEAGFDDCIEQPRKGRRMRWWYESPGVDPTPYRQWLDRHWGHEVDPAIHFRHRSPIVLFVGDYRIVDPCLRDFRFQKVIDPFTAFQEIDMFLGGVMADTAEAPSPMTDREKVVSHGMDTKWSFRKPPAGKA